MLVKLLNKLGACASTDTLARSIQHYVSEREKRGPENDCSPETLTVVFADNIDFMHSYTKVFCGNQNSSWHGTTVQAVQPLPSVEESAVVLQTPASTLTEVHSEFECMSLEFVYREDEIPQNSVHNNCQTSTRKRQSHLLSPCSSPSTAKSPMRKIQRRARTGTELGGPNKEKQFYTHRATACRTRPILTVSLEDFTVTENDRQVLDQLWEGVCVYMYQKHITLRVTTWTHFPKYQGLLQGTQSCTNRKVKHHIPSSAWCHIRQ